MLDDLVDAPEPCPTPPGEPPVVWRELDMAGKDAAQVYDRLQKLFASLPLNRQRQLQAKAFKMMRDQGVTYHLNQDQPAMDHVLPFDLFPRVIGPQEWEELSLGIAQRVKIWNAFLSDVFGPQEILRARILPFELVYDDPFYLRSAVRLSVPDNLYVQVAAFDLARNERGDWIIIEDHVSNLTGPSYAMQCRHVTSQVFPEALGVAEVGGFQNFSNDLLDHLQGPMRQGAQEPRVVMLSSDPENQAFYEHTLMARQMGIPLVRGNDLIVLNTGVFLRTIGGLEPIDVIYRRIEETWLDPMEFRHDSFWGVPGLMTCVRKGNVKVVNAIGASLGNNRALATYMPQMARFYFNESLRIPTVPRLLCFDPDQRDLVLNRLTSHRIALISDRSGQNSWDPSTLPREALEELRLRIQSVPGIHVAEPILPLSTLPVLSAHGLEERHAGLRLFVWGGAQPKIPSCALTRYAVQPGSRVISSALGGGIKDTWILGPTSSREEVHTVQVVPPQRRLRLNSRIADSLYWMGRYMCRAENTTRILKVIQELHVEDQHQQDLRSWNPLWEALARATGHATHFFKRSQRFRRQSIPNYILLDASNPSSVLNSIRNCRQNARAIRESVPPEVWFALNQTYQHVEIQAAKRRPDSPRAEDAVEDISLEEDLLRSFDGLTGTAAKNMVHDEGWHFWNMGIYLERALNTLIVTRQVFMKRPAREGQGPRRDESNLDALLRMLACQYAYRSLFQSRPAFQNVASLLLQDAQLPRSVLFCLTGTRDALQSVFGDRIDPLTQREAMPPLRHCIQLISQLEFSDLHPFFAPENADKVGRLRRWLDGLGHQLNQLAGAISDHYLIHQTYKILS